MPPALTLPSFLSGFLLLDKCLPVPAMTLAGPSVSECHRLPLAAYSWHCTFNLANVQIEGRTFKALRFLFKLKKKKKCKGYKHCTGLAFSVIKKTQLTASSVL